MPEIPYDVYFSSNPAKAMTIKNGYEIHFLRAWTYKSENAKEKFRFMCGQSASPSWDKNSVPNKKKILLYFYCKLDAQFALIYLANEALEMFISYEIKL